MNIKFCALAVLCAGLVPNVQATEPLDLDMVTRIRDEGLHRSQVMQTARHLTDVIGSRLTGSPQMREANEWTKERMESWGLINGRLEPFEFGRGWSFSHCAVHMLEPDALPLLALPKAWSPGLRGERKGLALRVEIKSEDDFEQYRGKLENRIVFLDEAMDLEPAEDPLFRRYSDEELADLFEFEIRDRKRDPRRYLERWTLRRKINGFLTEEKALATVEVSSRDAGVVRLGGTGLYGADDPDGIPSLVMAPEHYNRVLRLLEDEVDVRLALSIKARFHEEDLNAYNTIAEIAGSDLAHQVVMVGAHLDSWHAGTGATDNAAGNAVAMEAARILQALGVKPRRTIRVALWSGEEQGLHGSRAYVAQHLASRPEPEDPEQLKLPRFARKETWPLTLKPDHANLSAYFNLDNGSGKIRGIYVEENAAIKPIFDRWLEPFHDLGATTVTMRKTGGTDHRSFDSVGLPGFQFIQDRLAYSTRTHHTALDVFDHLQPKDLMQASTVLASFLYHAAMRDELLPRGPLPQERPDEDE